MNPTSKFSTVWEKRCQLRNASPAGCSPVGRNVLAATTREAIGILGHQAKSDQPAPVLAHERDVAQVELTEKGSAHPLDMTRVRVRGAVGRLVGAAEAHEVGCDTTKSGVGQDRDHLAVQEAPRRLAVHQQHDRSVGRPLVEVVNPQGSRVAARHVGVVRSERERGECSETVVGRAQSFHRVLLGDRSIRPANKRGAHHYEARLSHEQLCFPLSQSDT